MYKVLFLFLFFSFFSLAQKIPKIENWTNDFTNTLSPDELNKLNSKLRAFEDSTSNQIVVLIIPSLEGNSIEEVANDIFRQNQIGTKKNDNGVLILLAKNDKEIRIEVGYGLESRLTDATSSSIIRNEIIPYLKEGKYYEGIDAGINSIFLAIQGEYSNNDLNKDDNFNFWSFLIFLIFISIIFFKINRNRTFRIGKNSSGYRMGSWGGGFGGGGFGGFGGGSFGGGGFSGGGGMSGGGGASGRW